MRFHNLHCNRLVILVLSTLRNKTQLLLTPICSFAPAPSPYGSDSEPHLGSGVKHELVVCANSACVMVSYF